MVTIKDLMTQDLVRVEAGTPVKEAARLMKERGVGSVFVEQSDEITGIVTESDIIRKALGSGEGSLGLPVERIMSRPVIAIDQRRPLTEAAEMMDQHRTRHLAVTSGAAIVGVISVRDLLRPVSIDEF